MNNLDKTYTALLQDILDNGVEKKDRTGTGTLSVFGRQIRHNMSEGFPLLTTKKMHWKSIVTELLWFLRGDTNIKYLVDNDCHIWDGDAYKRYVTEWCKTNKSPEKLAPSQNDFINLIKTDDEFAKKWGELGPIYGKQWRSWEKCELTNDDDFGDDTSWGDWNIKQIDQIANSINLLKTDPDSRRNRVNAWNVGELDQMVLPPCHTDFQFYTRKLSLDERKQIFEDRGYVCDVWPFNGDWHGEYDGFGIPKRAISLMWNQRSVDTFLGLPFNIASYGLLLEIIAKEVNMVPDELIGNLGDVHLYSNHIEQAKEQIGRELTHDERVAIYSELGLTESTESRAKRYINKEQFNPYVPKRTRDPYPLPILNIFEPAIGKEISILDNLHIWSPNCFIIENYQSHPTIKAPLSN